MLFWAILIVLLIPLIYVILSANAEKQGRNRKLKAIQKRLAEKEKESKSNEEVE